MTSRLILASGSPRRQDLLQKFNIPFKTVIPSIPENKPNDDEQPIEYCRKSALSKAEHVYRNYPENYVLGVDTIVVHGNIILLKPTCKSDADRMLQLLSNKQHSVITSLALYPKCSKPIIWHETTTVVFKEISKAERNWYVSTGEGLDKAGAYAIQGLGGIFVSRIHGCFYNVVGLPVASLIQTLARFSPHFWPPIK